MSRWKLPSIQIDSPQVDLFTQIVQPKPITASFRILQALKDAGHHGLLNWQLQEVGNLSWHRRVGDLRAQGHNIKIERVSKGVFRYILEDS